MEPGEMLAMAAALVRDLGFLLYGGPVVAFAVILGVVGRLAPLTPWGAVRTWRAWGPGLGLSLGATVLGALVQRWLEQGAFTWGWQDLPAQLDLAAWLAFFALWVSNVKLEVWTLEPLRRLDQGGRVTDEAAYRAATARLARHLGVQAALVVAVLVLTRLAGWAAAGRLS